MAKSANRSNKAMNVPEGALMDGMTLNQLVAQSRGTDQEGSNIASNKMYEELSTSTKFNSASDVEKQIQMNDLLTKLPNDDAKNSVVSMINMTSPNPNIQIGGLTLKYGTPEYISQNNSQSVLKNVKSQLRDSGSKEAKRVVRHISTAQDLIKQRAQQTKSNATQARVGNIMNQAREMESNLRK